MENYGFHNFIKILENFGFGVKKILDFHNFHKNFAQILPFHKNFAKFCRFIICIKILNKFCNFAAQRTRSIISCIIFLKILPGHNLSIFFLEVLLPSGGFNTKLIQNLHNSIFFGNFCKSIISIFFLEFFEIHNFHIFF